MSLTHINCFVVNGVYLAWKDCLDSECFIEDVMVQDFVDFFDNCHLYAKHFERLSHFSNITIGNQVLKDSIYSGISELFPTWSDGLTNLICNSIAVFINIVHPVHREPKITMNQQWVNYSNFCKFLTKPRYGWMIKYDNSKDNVMLKDDIPITTDIQSLTVFDFDNMVCLFDYIFMYGVFV